MRTGLLGGTFDPPHDGHIALARAAKLELELDEILLVPVSKNPYKKHVPFASARDRLAMCSLAVEGEPDLAVCDIEVVRGGYSYTVDTLEDLAQVRPAHYWLVLGADALSGLMGWKEPYKVLRLARVAAAAREGQEVATLVADWDPADKARVDTLKMPEVPASSSNIRDQLARSGIGSLPLAPGVLEYIREKGLYRSHE